MWNMRLSVLYDGHALMLTLQQVNHLQGLGVRDVKGKTSPNC